MLAFYNFVCKLPTNKITWAILGVNANFFIDIIDHMINVTSN